ncbi:hypothetical protein [Streptomyces uncialis]|uniref:hypothetical protein n=1 Tax=Streptomyces uncialis TaxID=1048205 RepID=UPI00224CE8DA|nr:hypothetical protein [Streptomyces uncialis]MCX4659174.1 hypothetical protein [Streptomyces uncialis]
MPTSSTEPDFRLDGYEAVNARVDEAFWQHVAINQSDLTRLAEHHSDDGRHSHYVLHDRTVTWGIPGEPQIMALHLQRDPEARTFRFQHAMLPLPVMAQSWLIARGCPADSVRLPDGTGTKPADDATRALEQRLTGDGDHFALLTSYTLDDHPSPQITALLRAVAEEEPLPFRVLLEEADLTSFTHTLREGGFATYHEATSWWENHWRGEAVPLPPAPPSALRTSAPGLPPRAPSAPGPGRTR